MECSDSSKNCAEELGFHLLGGYDEESLNELDKMKTVITSLENICLKAKLNEEGPIPQFIKIDREHSYLKLRSSNRIVELKKVEAIFIERVKSVVKCLLESKNKDFATTANLIVDDIDAIFRTTEPFLDKFYKEIFEDDNPKCRLDYSILDSSKTVNQGQVLEFKVNMNIQIAAVKSIIIKLFPELRSLKESEGDRSCTVPTPPLPQSLTIPPLKSERVTIIPREEKVQDHQPLQRAQSKDHSLDVPSVSPVNLKAAPSAEPKRVFHPKLYHHHDFCLHPAFSGKEGYEPLPQNSDKAVDLQQIEMKTKQLPKRLTELKEAFDEYQESQEKLLQLEKRALPLMEQSKAATQPLAHASIKTQLGAPPPPPPGAAPQLVRKAGGPPPPPPGLAPSLHKGSQGGAIASQSQAAAPASSRVRQSGAKVEKRQTVQLNANAIVVEKYRLAKIEAENDKSALLSKLISEEDLQKRDLTLEEIQLLYNNFCNDAKVAQAHKFEKTTSVKFTKGQKSEDEIALVALKKAVLDLNSKIKKIESIEGEEAVSSNKVNDQRERCNRVCSISDLEKLAEMIKSHETLIKECAERKVNAERERDISTKELKSKLKIAGTSHNTVEELIKSCDDKIAALEAKISHRHS